MVDFSHPFRLSKTEVLERPCEICSEAIFHQAILLIRQKNLVEKFRRHRVSKA